MVLYKELQIIRFALIFGLSLSVMLSQGWTQDLKAEFESYCQIAQDLHQDPSFLWIQKRLEYQKHLQSKIKSKLYYSYIW